MSGRISLPSDNGLICIKVELLMPAMHNDGNDCQLVKFHKIIDTLQSVQKVRVLDSPARFVRPLFVAQPKCHYSTCLNELQCHRKILGFIGIAIEALPLQLDKVLECYDQQCSQYQSTVLDSRLFLFKSPQHEEKDSEHKALFVTIHESPKELGQLKAEINIFVKSLFWILESRRLDISYENSSSPVCPVNPCEVGGKFMSDIGKWSSRRRCIGRRRKQTADYSLLCGLPMKSMELYKSAINCLNLSNDHLWLGAAHEGYACAAFVETYSSMLKYGSEVSQDEHLMIHNEMDTIPSMPSSSVTSVTGDMLNHFMEALRYYRKFAYAIKIELECVFKTAFVLVHVKDSLLLNNFLNAAFGRILDDGFREISDEGKANICFNIAKLFKLCNCNRKASLYTRIAALFAISEDNRNKLHNHRKVYRLLLMSFQAYCSQGDGSSHWPLLQINNVRELHIAAIRAGYKEAAVRHLAYLLEHFHNQLNEAQLQSYRNELLLFAREKVISLDQPLTIDSDLILPVVCFSKLVKISSIAFKLPTDDYKVVESSETLSNIFIYLPRRKGKLVQQEFLICDTLTSVEVSFSNPLKTPLEIDNFVLCTEGVQFAASPLRLQLLPRSTSVHEIKGVFTQHGWSKITGYQFEIFGMKSTCHIGPQCSVKKMPTMPLEIIPALPLLTVTFLDETVRDNCLEKTIYLNQTVIVKIGLENMSITHCIKDVRLSMEQSILTDQFASVKFNILHDRNFDRIEPAEYFLLLLELQCTDLQVKISQEASNNETSDLFGSTQFTTSIKAEYVVVAENRSFIRSTVKKIRLCCRPAVVLNNWSFTSSERCFNGCDLWLKFYNPSNWEVTVCNGAENAVSIQPGKTKELSTFIECYTWPKEDLNGMAMTKSIDETQFYDCVLKHVKKQTFFNWHMHQGSVKGYFNTTYLLKNYELLREVCRPPLSIDLVGENVKHARISQIGEINSVAYTFYLKNEIKGSLEIAFALHVDEDCSQTEEDLLFVGPEVHMFSLTANEAIVCKEFKFIFCHSGEYEVRFLCKFNYVLDDFAFNYKKILLPKLCYATH